MFRTLTQKTSKLSNVRYYSSGYDILGGYMYVAKTYAKFATFMGVAHSAYMFNEIGDSIKIEHNNKPVQPYSVKSAGISLGYGILVGSLFPITIPAECTWFIYNMIFR